MKFPPFLLIVVIVVAVLAGGAAYSIRSDYDDTVAARYALVRDMAKVVDDHIHRTVHGADVAIQLLDKMIKRGGSLHAIADAAHWEQMKEYASGVDGGQSIWIFDANGNTVLETGQFPPRQVNVADRAYFQAAQRGEPIFVGPAVRAKATKAVFYSVSRPIIGEHGEFLGVIQASMDTEWLTDFYAMLEFDLDPLIAVIRKDGMVVARRPNLAAYIGQSVAGARIFQELEKAPEGLFQSVSTLDGKSRLAAYRTVGDYGLVVVAGVENDVALAAWTQRSAKMAAIALASAVLIILSIVAVWLSTRRAREARVALMGAMAENQQVTAELSQARHDHLTGLPARGLWLEMAENLRQRCQTEGMRMAVMLIDLDGFKGVNDTHGHDQGDEVLRSAASVLRGALRDTDIAGRLGGDEFALCLVAPAETITERAGIIAARIVARMEEIGHGIGCSVGVSLCPVDCGDLGCAIRKADEAMYEAKRLGKRQHVIWGAVRSDGAPWPMTNSDCAC